MAAKRVTSVLRPGLFKNKTAIVTGGGSGIGCAITQELLHLGCRVMIASRKLDRLQEAAEQMRQNLPPSGPAQLEFTQCNIREEDQVKNLISTTLSKFGRLDFLVNNGGGQFISPAENISVKGWRAVVETNLTGTFLCCREAYTQWMKENSGSIINIVMDMWKGFPAFSHSGAARAAVDNLTKTLALEWAALGIRVNAVAPGSSIYSDSARANYGEESNVFSVQIPRIPAKRLAKPEEVSGLVCYLLSPAAAFITGETVKIDGAQSLYNISLPWDIPDHKNAPTYSWEEDIAQQEKEDESKSKL